jgi:potassium efflux system protein
MLFLAHRILGIVLLPALLLVFSPGLAAETTETEQADAAQEEAPPAAPDLADFIPLAAELSGRLAGLETLIKGDLDVHTVESRYDEARANLNPLADSLQKLRGKTEEYRLSKLLRLREAVQEQDESFQKMSEPLKEAIRRLGVMRKEWLAEKALWQEWHPHLEAAEEFDPLRWTFDKAERIIDTALGRILPQLKAMLMLQEKAGQVQSQIYTLSAELDGLILIVRRGVLLNKSPPMFSPQYFSQFEGYGLWYTIQKGVKETSWALDKRFVSEKGWIVLIQGIISLLIMTTLYRKRPVIVKSERWRFLARRPFSGGLYLGYMLLLLMYQFEGVPPTVRLLTAGVAMIALSRLIGSLADVAWKKHLAYGLTAIFMVTSLLDYFNFPLPLFRLYTVLTSMIIILFCIGLLRKKEQPLASVFQRWVFGLGVLFFALLIILELWGKRTLALHMFMSSIRSVVTVFGFIPFIYMIRGGLEILLGIERFRQTRLRDSLDIDATVHRVASFIDVAIFGVIVLPAILMIWGVYDTLEAAIRGVLSLGFNAGSQRITIGLAIISAGTLYASFLVSWLLKKLLMKELLTKHRVARGARLSIARLASYVIIFFGFLLALSILGIEVTKITLVLSALSVGIGFGLQGIVNNFVSGLILLFEQPVRVGDTIEIDGKWSEIKRIGLRATTVETLEQADLIIPNSDMIYNQVINWTLNNRRVRLTIPVGVAYGSDVGLVIETLMACSHDNEMVVDSPTPQVLFVAFGESSLDFELRAWVPDVDNRLTGISQLHQEIDRRFREANIEIAFPQRDLHVRSVDESVGLRSPQPAK